MDSSGEDGGKLVDFPVDKDAVAISVGGWHYREAKCRHWRVELNEIQGHRRVYCVKCDETLDPFEVLMRYARTDDRLRRQAKGWESISKAWSWIWENGAAINISKAGGVRCSMKINGKRHTRKARCAQRDGLPALIIGAVESLKDMRRWASQDS